MENSEVVDQYHNRVRSDVFPFVPKSDNLLDIGGGTGATAAGAKAAGVAGRVGVIDLVDSAQADARLDFHHSGELEDAAFVQGVLDAEGPFDTILCLDILEHLVDPWALVAQLHQALKPGGHIVASIPNVRHYRVSGGLFFKNSWELADAGILDRTHLRFFVKDTAVQLMTHSGLKLELVESPELQHHQQSRRIFKKVTRGKLDSLIDVDYVVRVRRDS